MKRIISYICLLLGVLACQELDFPDVPSSEKLPDAKIASSCVILSEHDSSTGAGEPMTRALIGQETTRALRANFIKVDEIVPDNWSSSSQYDITQTSMTSLELAQIVEADIMSSASGTDNYHLRSADFNPTLFYKYKSKENSPEPELAHRVGMVGWYPLTYDVPEGLGEEDAQAQFRASECMKIIDGKVCVEFKNKLDGQTDLMVTDYREGRMMMNGFKHEGSDKDWDIQPFGHSNPNTLDPNKFDYINYFTFHHYLSAIRIFIQASAEDRGKAAWTTIDEIMLMNQPSTAVVALPTQQSRGTGAQTEHPVVLGTTATLPSEGVTPIFGDVVSWGDYINFDLIKTPMFTNNAPDDSYYQSGDLPYKLPTTGEVKPKYLGYALVKPDQEVGDGRTVQLKVFTDAGSYLVDLPETDENGHLLRPGKIYDYIISISAVGGVDVVIRNDDDDKYQALAPYNNEYQGYEYSNCYVITKEMIKNKLEGHYSGFFFRAYVPGRGSKGDITGDQYPADYKLNPAFVKIFYQSTNKPLEHCELVQGYVRFNLDGRTCIKDGKVEMYPGNALIAAYDDNDNIIWTWHIWVVDKLKEVTVDGCKLLDRNIGALWTPASQDKVAQEDSLQLSYGFYYQWGRKDPSPGPMTWNYDITDMRTIKYYTMDGPREDVAEVYMIGAAPTIENSVRNPLVILSPSDVSPVYSNDWLWLKNDDLWGGVSHKKTIYDPCPYGYKVPEGELKTLLYNNRSSLDDNANNDNDYYGGSFTKNGAFLFFPYAGWKGDDVKRVSRTHAWMKVGFAGDYQDATFDSSSYHRGRTLLARDAFDVTIYGSTKNQYSEGYNYNYTNRTAAASVRCVRYEGEPLRNDDAITHN